MAEEIVISGAYLPYDPIQRHSIKLNLKYESEFDFDFCDKNVKFCDDLKQDQNRSLLPKFDLQERTTKEQWITFTVFQVLDVYSTSKALKYDCIKEVNPLFTESPSDTRLILTKSILLLPSLLYNDGWEKITPSELDNTNMLYAAVVGNNFRLLNDAKRNCNRIR
jgi:hypothetical protein